MRPGEQQILLFAWHRIWPVLRPILGIIFLILGVLGIILPILQGILFLLIGAALIGQRHRMVRWPRVQYQLILRAMRRSSKPWLRWAGQRGHQALQTMRRRIHELRNRRFTRLYARRRFRIVLEPPHPQRASLDTWRRRYDPGQRYGLPPHIVLVAASRSCYREELEQAIRRLASTQAPFLIRLGAPAIAEAEHRLICPVIQGQERIRALREAIAILVGDQVRFSQRQLWPGLTIAKLRQPRSLHAAFAAIQQMPLEWEAHSLTVYEERFGHVWYCVRSLPFFGNTTPTRR